ncbi:MAG: adenylate/guanylate cyclase domain-containing protein, partial [Sulfuricella sp.]
DSSGLNTLERLGRTEFKDIPQFQARLAQLRPQLDHDQLLARTLTKHPVVLGYYFTDFQGRESGKLPEPAFGAGSFTDSSSVFVTARGYGANLAEFQRATGNAGHFTPFPDFDGVARREPMLIEYGGAYYEALSLAMVRTLYGAPPIQAVIEQDSGGETLEGLRVGKLKIPVDENVSALIPYRGKQGSYPYISASDVLHGRAGAGAMAGAIVLVGTTAPGLMDLRSTPVGAVYPGVEIHANLIAGMLDHDIKEKPAYMLGVDLAQTLLLGLLLAILMPTLNPVRASLLALGALLWTLAVNLALWQYANMVMPLAATVTMVLTLFVLGMSYGFFVEARAKRQISGLFGQYVPPQLVDEMSDDPGSFTMEGENREMTVLFADVRNFTSMSEGLDPKALSKLMNDYMTPMTRVIHQHRGTVDKYIGDAIMAFWGAPLADPDHARHAVTAALEMQHTLAALRPQFVARGWTDIRIGIGINSGMMNVGNMGSEFRTAYTVMGDAVNLGSRLEGLTKVYGVGIMVSEDTKNLLPDIVFRELDKVRVKGKDIPVSIYEPLGPAEKIDPSKLDELREFQRAVELYRTRQWDLAEACLQSLQQAAPQDTLYPVYQQRIARFRANPPAADWDGTFVFLRK